jgi:hypothetical protein
MDTVTALASDRASTPRGSRTIARTSRTASTSATSGAGCRRTASARPCHTAVSYAAASAGFARLAARSVIVIVVRVAEL